MDIFIKEKNKIIEFVKNVMNPAYHVLEEKPI